MPLDQTNANVCVLNLLVMIVLLPITIACQSDIYPMNLVHAFKETKAYRAALAISSDQCKLLEVLVKEDTSIVDVKDQQYGGSLLYLTAHFNRLECARVLIASGAKVDDPGNDGNTALHIAAQQKFGCQLIELLIENGADPNRSSRHIGGGTPLHEAVVYGPRNVDCLLEHGALVSFDSEAKSNPIFSALILKRYDLVTKLIGRNEVTIDMPIALEINGDTNNIFECISIERQISFDRPMSDSLYVRKMLDSIELIARRKFNYWD